MTADEEWAWQTNTFASQIARCDNFSLVKIGFDGRSMTSDSKPCYRGIRNLLETSKTRSKILSAESAPVQRVWHAAPSATFDMVSEIEKVISETLMFTGGAILLLTDCPLAGSALHAGIVDYAYKASVGREAHGGI